LEDIGTKPLPSLQTINCILSRYDSSQNQQVWDQRDTISQAAIDMAYGL